MLPQKWSQHNYHYNVEQGWDWEAIDFLMDGNLREAQRIHLHKYGTNAELKDFYKKDKREFEINKRIESRRLMRQQFEQLKIDLDRQKKQIVEEVINEAMTTPRSKRLVTSTSSFKRDNLNLYAKKGRDRNDAILG